MSSHTRPRPHLRLPLSVFAPPSTTSSTGSGANASSKRTAPKGILDTHVHLWTQVQKDDGTLVWPWELRDETTTATTALAQEHSLDQYMLLSQRGAAYIGGGRREAASTETRSTGCVFVQGERRRCKLLCCYPLDRNCWHLGLNADRHRHRYELTFNRRMHACLPLSFPRFPRTHSRSNSR